MQQKSSEPSYYPEDEIDLREVFSVLVASKRFIFIVALLFLIAASVYAFSLIPTYKGTAEIRIANYETSKINCSTNITPKSCTETLPHKNLIITGPDLIRNLKIAFSDRLSNLTESESEALIVNMSSVSNDMIKFTTKAISKELATGLISEILTYIQNKHGEELNNLKIKNRVMLNLINDELSKIHNEFNLINYSIDNIEKKIEIVELKYISSLESYKSELRKPKLEAYYDSQNLLNDISIWLMRNLPNVSDEQIDEVQNLEDAFALINKHITSNNGLAKIYRDDLNKLIKDTRASNIEANKYNNSLFPIEFEFEINRNLSASTLNLPSSDILAELTQDILFYEERLVSLNAEKKHQLNRLINYEELNNHKTIMDMRKLDFEFLVLDSSYTNSEIIEQSVSDNPTTKYSKPLLIIVGFLLGLISASFLILSKYALINYLNGNKK